MSNDTKTVIGLMSGTSADGVDAAMVRTNGEATFEFIDFLSVPYETDFRNQLLNCARGKTAESDILAIESRLTDLHASVVTELSARNESDVDLIGFHGHTILHKPKVGQTRQIGDGKRLAKACDAPVVYDFRSEDMRQGGQGAPLVPLFQSMLFSHLPKPSVVVNIGGVANIAWLDGDTIIAGDTGPGCGLLDAWISSTMGIDFDRDGKIAKQGTADPNVITALDELPYFTKPFPKSADRYDFDTVDVSHLSPADGAATLCEVTAHTIAGAIRRIGNPQTTWLTGGGAKHPVIVRRLKSQLGDVRTVEEMGLRAESLEAECFAWLAVRRLRDLPTTLPSTTGCRQPTCGGTIANP